jgi:hypothetical protein
MLAHHQGMHLEDGLVDEADGLFDGLIVDFDYEAAQQLVEVVFQTVFFGVSYLDRKLHRTLTFNSIPEVHSAWIVPTRRQQEVLNNGPWKPLNPAVFPEVGSGWK